ncbi:MAG: potassium channel family protein [bacterium]
MLGEKYCILHIDFPDDQESKEFMEMTKQKKAKIAEKIKNSDFDFEGAILYVINFTDLKTDLVIISFLNAKIITDFWCPYAEIKGVIVLNKTKIGGCVNFNNLKIKGSIQLNGAKIGKDLILDNAMVNGEIWLDNVDIKGKISLRKTKIIGQGIFSKRIKIRERITVVDSKIICNIQLSDATINEGLFSYNSQITGDVLLYFSNVCDITFDHTSIHGNVSFINTVINRYFHFIFTDITGLLNLRNTKFLKPAAQEEACRRAKLQAETSGNREEEDYYFYREMQARRKRKIWYKRYPEWLFLQSILRYGTSWTGIVVTWPLLIIIYAALFWVFKGILNSTTQEPAIFCWEYLYFSIVTVTTLGYGDYQPLLGWLQILAGSEAIIGTFMWAALIAVFARKYLR